MSDERRDGTLMVMRSRGPHPYIYFALPFALALMAAGVGGIVTMHLVLGLACIGGASWVLTSSAYSIWGTMSVRENDETITLTERLGPLERVVATFYRAQIRAVVPFTPSPGILLWPGSAGEQLRVVLDDREIRVAGGLALDTEQLQSVAGFLRGGDPAVFAG